MNRRLLPLRNKFEVELLEAGKGPPLVYLHGIWDADEQAWLERLAAERRVLAPRLPGFGASTGERHLLDIHDLIYFGLDLLDALGFEGGPLVGHCLGGMLAAELAAVQPGRFIHLALMAPFGLWNPACPAPDFFSAAPDEVEGWLARGQAKPVLLTPNDEEQAIQAALARAKSMSAAARYLWPLPNHGLKKRAHRISAPTLVIWGERDGICPPQYAYDFQQLLRGARLEVLPELGHLPHVQQPDKIARLLGSFLA